jgi:hypothetical protein
LVDERYYIMLWLLSKIGRYFSKLLVNLHPFLVSRHLSETCYIILLIFIDISGPCHQIIFKIPPIFTKSSRTMLRHKMTTYLHQSSFCLHQTTLETLKYLQQWFETANLSENFKNCISKKLPKMLPF